MTGQRHRALATALRRLHGLVYSGDEFISDPPFVGGAAVAHKAVAFPSELLDRTIDDFPGRLGVYLEDVVNGATYERNADRRYPTVSVCKVPVMIELFKQAEAGRIDLGERRRLRRDISRHGTSALATLEDDPELTLYDYARLMVSYSDNMATDMVMEAVGLHNVNPTMEAFGYPNTRVNMTMSQWHYTIAGLSHLEQTRENNEYVHQRLVEGHKDWAGLPYTDSLDNNVTTPREIADIMRRIHLGEIVSPSASAAMLEMLKRCTSNTMIPHGLRGDVVVAHKIGSSRRIKVDAGVAYLPSGPLVVGVMALADSDDDRGRETIAELVRIAVSALSPESIDAKD